MNNEQQSSDILTNQNIQNNDMNSTNVGSISVPTESQTSNLDLNQQPINNINQTETLIDTESNINNDIPAEPIIETIPDNTIVEQQIPVQQTTEQSVETLDMQSSQVNEPVNNIQIQSQSTLIDPTLTDNFNEVPVPPVFENEIVPKEKKVNKKVLIIILIVVLIAIVGIGIYYFLSVAKSKAPSFSIVTKELKLELGEELSRKMDNYATISGYDKNKCTLDTKDVSSFKVGAYKYYITCDNHKVEGTIIVDDTKKPKAILNDIVVLPNATVKPEDFIESCIDASTCTYEFKNEVTVANNLLTVGEYTIEIVISDEYNNESTVKAKLIVSTNAPVKYLTCTSTEEDIDDIYAVLTKSYRFGVDSNNMLYNAVKNSEFKFEKIEDYKNVKKDYDEDKGINDVIGKADFNEKNKTITIKSNTTLEEINKELNTTLASDIGTIEINLIMRGYTCK